jgi:SAM-dependent methyltransferase
LPDRHDLQRTYWNENLDAANLGGETSDSADSLVKELQFSCAPDIQGMLSAVEPAPGRLLLEIGSGLGANALLAARRGAAVIALDISHDRLATLRKRTADLRQPADGPIYAIKARAEALPFRTSSLDGAFCRAVLIHTDLPAACREATRVLRPGASVAFAEPMRHNPLVNLYRATLAPKEWRTITTYFSDPEIRAITAGLTAPRDRRFYLLSFLAFAFQYAVNWPRAFRLSLAVLSSIDCFLMRAIPALRRYAWFVLITGRKPIP